MSDEVEHYLAVYHQDSCMTTRPKPMVKSVEGVSRERWAGSKITCAEVQANYPSAGGPQPPRLVSVTKRQVSELGAEFLPENPLNLCARNRLQVGAWRHFLGVTVNRSFGARY